MIGLLNHKGQKQTHRLIRHISKETDLTKSSIIQIIRCIFDRKCILLPTRLLSMIASLFTIYTLQGSVTTQLTCCGLSNNLFIANCPPNVPVKKF